MSFRENDSGSSLCTKGQHTLSVKGPSKYLRLCRLCSLCRSSSTLPLYLKNSLDDRYASALGYSNKTQFTKTGCGWDVAHGP